MWKGTENIEVEKDLYVVLPTVLTRILRMYQDSPKSGDFDGASHTYRELRQHFKWPNMKRNVKEY